MDAFKYPLDKLIYFLATLLPGFVAIVIFELAHPGCFSWFFAISALGYRTKVALALFVAFVVGYSITALWGYFLATLGGAVGGALAGLRPYKPSSSYDVAPWRDLKWRYALKRYLGRDAPEDIPLIGEQGYAWRKSLIDSAVPEDQRQMAITKLQIEQLESQANDSRWAEWYEQIDRTLKEQMPIEWMVQVRQGLDANFHSTAVYVLVSSIWVPTLRQWWCLGLATLWTIFFMLKEAADVSNITNKWDTLNKQISYLLGQEPVSTQGSLFSSPAP